MSQNANNGISPEQKKVQKASFESGTSNVSLMIQTSSEEFIAFTREGYDNLLNAVFHFFNKQKFSGVILTIGTTLLGIGIKGIVYDWNISPWDNYVKNVLYVWIFIVGLLMWMVTLFYRFIQNRNAKTKFMRKFRSYERIRNFTELLKHVEEAAVDNTDNIGQGG